MYISMAQKRQAESIIRILPNELKSKKARESVAKRYEKATNVDNLPTNVERTNEIEPTNVPILSTIKLNESKVKEDTNVSSEFPPLIPFENLKEKYAKIKKNGADKKDIILFFKENKPDFEDAYFDLWNLFADDFGKPKIRGTTNSRKAKMKIRIKEKNFNFLDIILKAAKSTFLKQGNFFAFDWIIENDTNYMKILEGNYDNKKENNGI